MFILVKMRLKIYENPSMKLRGVFIENGNKKEAKTYESVYKFNNREVKEG